MADTKKDQEPRAMIFSGGESRTVELPDHGQLTVKVQDGKVTLFEVTEKHKF